MLPREQNINRAKHEQFDIVIIGGGITGAGIAYTSAKLGWKTLVIDKNDFASGTSSRSAKMIHGGLRYLEQLEVGLVKEALHERQHLLDKYPHLVKPQPFFMPIYNSKMSKLKIGIGLSGYDMLSGKSKIPKHKSLSTNDIKTQFPQIKTEKIVGGFIYYDAKTNDARLTNEVIQDAVNYNAVALNYTECVAFNKNNAVVDTLECYDKIGKEKFTIKSKLFVVATGIWTDEVLKTYNSEDAKTYMAPSKGIHIVVEDKYFPKNEVLIVPTANGDKRFLWCMPWEDNLNIIGTTDTDYHQSLDEMVVEQSEINYILESVNAQLKDVVLTENDILSVFAGIRPLLNDDKENEKSNQRSRDYKIWWNCNNMLTISGGKLTSFLSMANHCIDVIKEKYKFETNIKDREEVNQLKNDFSEKYGCNNAQLIAEIIESESNVALSVKHEKYPYCFAEFLFFIRHQFVQKIDDLLTRRTLITYLMKDFDTSLVDAVANLMAKELHWNETQKAQEILAYKTAWQLMHSWK